ncbi:YcxB family protein [Kitasatospora sp. NPDC052896]|uniref:YcxB family protein n=1 Tax=Kitasatospora sp. NPDC052896 TaxID=3364061 RepID=UPI0037C75005
MAMLTELTLRRAARLGTKHDANAPRTFVITAEAFTSQSGAVTRSLDWSRMHSVRRKGDWWHLHASEKMFQLLPVRAFTDDQRAEFESFLVTRGWGTAS